MSVTLKHHTCTKQWQFTSSIPQPSKNASPTKGNKGRHLGELSAAEANSRHHIMGPPAKMSRTTLAERAGQFPDTQKAGLPSYQPGTAYSNASARNGQSRNTSLSSSVSSGSRPHSSASSRTFSNSSYSRSVGYGSRPATSHSNRSISNSSSSRLQKNHPRSANILEAHQEERSSSSILGKRKSTGSPSLMCIKTPNEIWSPKIRGNKSLRKPQSLHSMRETSLVTGMKGLNIADRSKALRPIEERGAGTPSSCLPRPTPSPMKKIPSTPSSPYRSPRKMKSQTLFLSKETNTTAAFDLDQKWEEMENFRDQIAEHTKARMEEHNSLKETMVFYKSMSMIITPFCASTYRPDTEL